MKQKKILSILAIACMLVCLVVVATACNDEDTSDIVDGIQGLYKPTEIKYDNGVITWNKVTLADYYKISINGGEQTRVNTNSYPYATVEAFSVTVYAVSGENEESLDANFTPLGTVGDISVSNNGTLSWEPIEGATGYRIMRNGTEVQPDVTTTSYQAPVGESTIKVKAVVTGNNSYFASWSEVKKVKVISAPTQIKYDGDYLSWTGNSSKYELKINEVTQEVTGNRMEYNANHTDFTVEIKALGDYKTTYDSSSTVDSFYYLKPVTNMAISNGVLTWDAVEGADGYKIQINNQAPISISNETKYEQLTAGSLLNIKLLPYNSSPNYFSHWTETPLSAYILPSPEVVWNESVKMDDGIARNAFTWHPVDGAVGYLVELEKDGVVESQPFSASDASYTQAFLQVGEYKVRVKAVAPSNSDYYDSQFSLDTIVKRLPAPNAPSAGGVKSEIYSLASGITFNYNIVPGATGYQLYKDGQALESKRTSLQELKDTEIINSADGTEQNITYMIQSLGGVNKIAGATHVTLPCLLTDALSYNIVVQAMPKDLKMDGFNASWTTVAGSNGYGVSVDGRVELKPTKNEQELQTMTKGSHKLSVCTAGNGSTVLASQYTAELPIIRLDAPTDIKILDQEGEGRMSYKNVEYATSYKVHIDGKDISFTLNEQVNMYQYVTTESTTIFMTAEANLYNKDETVYYMTSPNSQKVDFMRLATPTFPEGAFSNHVEMVWKAPSNINLDGWTPAYQISENGVVLTGGVANATKWSLANLEGGRDYVFTVKAIGDHTKYLDSETSLPITIHKLATPTLNVANNRYEWSDVLNASAYVMEIDGKRVNNTDMNMDASENYYYKPHYTARGTYSVKLYAVGDGRNTINSSAYEYNQVVEQLISPEFTFSYGNDYFIKGTPITVQITRPSANCSSYLYEIAGTSITESSLTASLKIESPGVDYQIKAKALGGDFDDNDIYYVDSPFAGGNGLTAITILSTPTLTVFSINNQGIIKWGTVTNALGYDYQIAYNGGDFGAIEHTGTATINDNIDNYKDFASITIRLQACGNGTNIISSEWIEWTWYNANA